MVGTDWGIFYGPAVFEWLLKGAGEAPFLQDRHNYGGGEEDLLGKIEVPILLSGMRIIMRGIASPACKVCVDYESRDERKEKFKGELLFIGATMCRIPPLDVFAKYFGEKEVKE